MPWVSNIFVEAARIALNSFVAPPPFDSKHLDWQLKNHILPTLSSQFMKMKDSDKKYRSKSSNKKQDSEDPLSAVIQLASVLDIGILAPFFPSAHSTLFELGKSEFSTVRAASSLALLFAGSSPESIDELGLRHLVESGIFYQIPLHMYSKILEKLPPFIVANSELKDLFLSQHVDRRPITQMYQKAETAIFLANMGIAHEKIITELLDWATFFDSYSPLYPKYRIRSHKAVANLIMKNQTAFEMVKKKISEEGRTTPWAEVDGWFDALAMIDIAEVDHQKLSIFFEIANLVVEIPRYHVRTVQIIVNLTNQGSAPLKNEVESWILTRLRSKDSEVVYRTLQGIWDLKEYDKKIEQQIVRLAKGKGNKSEVRTQAIEAVGKLGIFNKAAMAVIQEAARSEDFLLAQKAKRILSQLDDKSVTD